MAKPFIVGIRFGHAGKVYHFDSSNVSEMQVGDFAVVETSRGLQIGEVVQLVPDAELPTEGTWKPIFRRATPSDLVKRQLWQKKELEALARCRQKLSELGFQGVKVVAAEFTFDGSRLTFLYNTEGEGKVDLGKLRKAMKRTFPRSRVEFRQIGPRDVAKILGGMGACGLEERCCTRFLTEFSPISIRMAKEQGVSLSPSEITGMCGRLRCCLLYEYEAYVEARKQLPKRKKRVVTPEGEGKVVDLYPLKRSVLVRMEDGETKEFSADELEPYEELQALKQKAKQPCPIHGDEGCNCQQKQNGGKQRGG